MPRFPIGRPCLLLIAAALSTLAAPTARGQVGLGRAGGMMGGPAAPRFEPGGMWARVVTATPKWLVLENAGGQQFPVSFNSIDVFVIRWPANAMLAPPGTLAEVTGFDLHNGSIMAGHVDLYEGSARALVTPTSLVLSGYNRVMAPVNPFQINTFGFGTFSLVPGEEMVPQRRHVVGPLMSGNPLLIAVPGNQAVRAIPGGGGMSVTQVTIGSPSFIRAGDAVWCLPVNANPQTLALARLVVYKNVPLAQFVP